MIKYGSDRVTELQFADFRPRFERRDNQWIDIELRFGLTDESLEDAPQDLIDLTIYVICTSGGQIAQIIPQDEGCDCEYQFTAGEKAQIEAFINRPDVQAQIEKTASQM
ncbi:hypothetical protein [Paenibacillus abyssi]|uniref:Uncharacterized protein n=1 Tax=Paenibacillus abyssi TaxID=1340531 RepID=A0A917CK83_9BACL|nr:hypothetical protein [Paenibacillus abyssi]GGF90058.1 hypothetical protein GCM10010916_04280 [Paenibacillus abyssi]